MPRKDAVRGYLRCLFKACKKGDKLLIILLIKTYFEDNIDFIDKKIGKSLFYAKSKIDNPELKKWYSEYVIPLIKSYD